MSKSRFKRPIAMLVAVLLLLSLMPVTVFAADENYDDLDAKTAEAVALAEAVIVTDDGTSVPSTKQWMTAADKAELDDAISDAEAMLASKDAADQQVIDDLVTALTDAMAKAADGTQFVGDYDALDAKTAEAVALAEAVIVTDDGTSVPSTKQWMTAADKAELDDAISDAEAMLASKDAADQATIDALTTALTDAMAKAAAGTKPSLEDIVNPDSDIEVDGGYLGGIVAATNSDNATTVNDLLSNFTAPAGYNVVATKDGTPVTSGNVGTGMTVQLIGPSGLVEELVVVVTADLDGDGVSTVLDFARMAKHLRGITPLSGAYLAAADVSGTGGNPSILDFAAIAKLLRGLSA